MNAALPIDQASLPVDEVNFSPDPPFQSRSFLLHISFDYLNIFLILALTLLALEFCETTEVPSL